MNRKQIPATLITVLLLFAAIVGPAKLKQADDRFISFTVDARKQHLSFYWKDSNGERFGSIENLRRSVEGRGSKLLFAMNGGMFTPLFSPKGLFIQSGQMLAPLDTGPGEGNFYLKPNGVFYVEKNGKAIICNTKSFPANPQISFATQSGPLLVTGSQINIAFKPGSANLNIRNGVGILPDGRVVFAISKVPVNFYDFAYYFKLKGCSEALYLDGFVSRMYLPEKNLVQADGDFGVIIAVTGK